MPSRYIREGLLDSEKMMLAGELAEVLFVRLLLVADDFGRFDGRVSVICRRCWPSAEDGKGPTQESVAERLAKLAEHGLILTYVADGKPFIYIPNFKQRTRASKSKCPDPPLGFPQESPSEAGQVPDKWRTPDGPPQAGSVSVSVSVSRSISTKTTVEKKDSGAPEPVDNPAPPSRNSTSRPRATTKAEAKTQVLLEEQEAAKARALPPDVPLPDAVSRYVPKHPRDKPERQGKTYTPADEHHDANGHEPDEVPWWHSPNGIIAAGTERGIFNGDEEFPDFTARVVAAYGPGPWFDEQPPEVQKRVKHWQRVGVGAR